MPALDSFHVIVVDDINIALQQSINTSFFLTPSPNHAACFIYSQKSVENPKTFIKKNYYLLKIDIKTLTVQRVNVPSLMFIGGDGAGAPKGVTRDPKEDGDDKEKA